MTIQDGVLAGGRIGPQPAAPSHRGRDARPSRARRIPEYPAAAGLLTAFTFVVLVAPQNDLPLLRAFSPALLLGGLALVLFLLQAGSQGDLAWFSSPEFRLMGVFAALAFLSIPFSLWPGGSWALFFDQFIKSLIVYALVGGLLLSPRHFRQHLRVIFMAGSFIALMVIRSGHTVEGYRLAGGSAGLTGNPNDLALTLNVFLPFAVVLSQRSFGISRLLAACYAVLAVVAVVLTYSRAGFLTLATIGGLLVLRAVRRQGSHVLIVVAVLGALAVAALPEGYSDRVSSIIDHDKDELGSASSRWDNMVRATKVALEHPLLGVGLGQDVLAINEKGGNWSVTHNVYLQIASDLGIPALVVFLLLFRQLIRYVRTIQAKPPGGPLGDEVAHLAAATEISLWGFAVAAMFHPAAYNLYFFYIAGFASALHSRYLQLTTGISND